MKIILFTGMALLLLAPCSHAQEKDNRLPVIVSAQCERDPVGERLVYRAREELRASKRMREETEYLRSIVQVQFVCLDPQRDDSGISSKYSYVITALNTDGDYDYFISSGVGQCGNSRISYCAEGIIAKVDNALDNLIKTVRDGKFKYKK